MSQDNSVTIPRCPGAERISALQPAEPHNQTHEDPDARCCTNRNLYLFHDRRSPFIAFHFVIGKRTRAAATT
jgi:hypothetical protein